MNPRNHWGKVSMFGRMEPQERARERTAGIYIYIYIFREIRAREREDNKGFGYKCPLWFQSATGAGHQHPSW